jgi:hypothetical protein
MSRVVIVARTRMQHDRLCIGGHDLDNGFRGVRLLDKFGDHWPPDVPFSVGSLWRIRYRRPSASPPAPWCASPSPAPSKPKVCRRGITSSSPGC